MADDEKQRDDEIGRLLAEDPNANIVEGEQQVWLLTGNAVDIAREAVRRPRESAAPAPFEQAPDPSLDR